MKNSHKLLHSAKGMFLSKIMWNVRDEPIPLFKDHTIWMVGGSGFFPEGGGSEYPRETQEDIDRIYDNISDMTIDYEVEGPDGKSFFSLKIFLDDYTCRLINGEGPFWDEHLNIFGYYRFTFPILSEEI